MRYDEVTKLVTSSSPEDWAMISEGPLFLDRFTNIMSDGRDWLEADSHNYLVINKADVNLRLAWGLELDSGLHFEGWSFPDQSISQFAVDAFWQGALVARWTLLLVDGARSYLPVPERVADRSGWTASADEIALARLLQELVGRPAGQFDSYMARAGIVPAADA